MHASRVFCVVRALSSNVRTSTSVTLLDCPGFQNPASCGRSGAGGGGGASFDDLCHNYINERLQLMFHHAVFTSQQDLYAQVRACGTLDAFHRITSYIYSSRC